MKLVCTFGCQLVKCQIILGDRICSNCFVVKTPLWRRDPKSGGHLCNACGLYQRNNSGSARPLERPKNTRVVCTDNCVGIKCVCTYFNNFKKVLLKTSTLTVLQLLANLWQRNANITSILCTIMSLLIVFFPQTSSKHKGKKCYNCQAEKTTLWRQITEQKITVCNACGLYYNLHNVSVTPSLLFVMRRSPFLCNIALFL